MPRVDDILRHPEDHEPVLVKVAEWIRGDGAELVEAEYAAEAERRRGREPRGLTDDVDL
jgi:hypothetical protein